MRTNACQRCASDFEISQNDAVKSTTAAISIVTPSSASRACAVDRHDGTREDRQQQARDDRRAGAGVEQPALVALLHLHEIGGERRQHEDRLEALAQDDEQRVDEEARRAAPFRPLGGDLDRACRASVAACACTSPAGFPVFIAATSPSQRTSRSA